MSSKLIWFIFLWNWNFLNNSDFFYFIGISFISLQTNNKESDYCENKYVWRQLNCKAFTINLLQCLNKLEIPLQERLVGIIFQLKVSGKMEIKHADYVSILTKARNADKQLFVLLLDCVIVDFCKWSIDYNVF